MANTLSQVLAVQRFFNSIPREVPHRDAGLHVAEAAKLNHPGSHVAILPVAWACAASLALFSAASRSDRAACMRRGLAPYDCRPMRKVFGLPEGSIAAAASF